MGTVRSSGMLVVAALTTALASCSGDGGTPDAYEGTSGPPRQSAEVDRARSLAPLVHLAAGEEHGPIDASAFIRTSTLMWAASSFCGDNRISRSPAERDLATPDHFREQARDRACDKYGKVYTTTEPTRPYSSPVDREGFYLDADDALHDRGGPTAPAYVQYVLGRGEHAGMTAYVYWFFYPWNRSVMPVEGIGGNHEGDWEKVAVVTDRSDRPVRVVLSQHETKCAVPWDEIVGPDGHPVVFSALGSHGSYAEAGAYGIHGVPFPDDANRGTPWRTWDRLKEVHTQLWWGYGGGWGEVGDYAPLGRHVLDTGKIQTGPSGPMPPPHRDMAADLATTTPCPGPLLPTATPGVPVPSSSPSPSASPSASPSPSPSASAPPLDAFVGSWVSARPVNRPGWPKPHHVRVVLWADRQAGSPDGLAEYSDDFTALVGTAELSCSADLEYTGTGPGRIVLAETEKSDVKGNCPDAGTVTLTRTGDRLTYDYAGGGGTARTTLVRN